MSVWLTIPSARPSEEAEKCLKLWRERGYKIALWLDPQGSGDANLAYAQRTRADTVLGMTRPYPGYSAAINELIADALIREPDAEWFVIGGDDTQPDLNHTAEEIARQCAEHFGGHEAHGCQIRPPFGEHAHTFGVMQPTGDRFADGQIDRIAGSAWIGRDFARRMYGGKGPLWREYTRFYMDEELQCVAQKLGVFQQRRDLVQLHRWFGRATDALDSPVVPREIPPHLQEQQARWTPEQNIFRARKARGFPGHEPIP